MTEFPIEVLPAIPGHMHVIEVDGTLSCGCVWPESVAGRLAVYAARQATKREDARYRQAARRMVPGGKVPDYVSVQRDASGNGAFLVVQIYVPKAEAEKETGTE